MSDWATFHGSVAEAGDNYTLTAAGENGILSLPKECVLFEHGKISVKVGSIANIIREPTGVDDIVGFEAKVNCKRTCAIGMVEICCDDGRVVGACTVRDLV
jgi:hypothetical protein